MQPVLQRGERHREIAPAKSYPKVASRRLRYRRAINARRQKENAMLLDQPRAKRLHTLPAFVLRVTYDSAFRRMAGEQIGMCREELRQQCEVALGDKPITG